MATIQLIINAINNASRTITEVTGSLEAMGKAADMATDKVKRLNLNLDKAAGQARFAAGAMKNFGDEAIKAAAKTKVAAQQAADALDEVTRAATEAGAAQAAASSAATAGNTAAAASAKGVAAAQDRNTLSLRRGRFGWLALGGAIRVGRFAVTAWHLALDVVVETLAVLIPALVTVTAGLTAFGLAGVDSARAVAHFMQNAHIVMDATGKSIPPFTGNLERLHEQVKPMVWQLFGDAIKIAGANAHMFNKLAVDTGGVVDRLAARFTVFATKAGPGVQHFFAVGSKDAAQFGRILANLGHALFNLILISEKTHIAEVLLQGVVGLTGLLNLITSLPTPILAVVFALHGIYLWGIVFTFILKKLIWGFVGLIAKVKELGLMLAGLATNPVAWVAAAIIAIGLFAWWAGRAGTATTRWLDSLQKGIRAAKPVELLSTIMSDQAQVTGRLAAAQEQLGHMQEYVAGVNLHTGQAIMRVNPAYTRQQTVIDQLTGGNKQLAGQYDLVGHRLQVLAGRYGGATQAQGAMVLAGITTKQLLDTTSGALARIIAQIDGLVAGYKAMGQNSGQISGDMQVMAFVINDQYTNMQKLNQAWDTYLGLITSLAGGQVAVEQAIAVVTEAAKAQGASFNGTNKASLDLQSALFTQLLPSIQQVADGMRNAGASARSMAHVIATDLKPAVDEGALSNTGFRNTVYDLAKEAGYHGVNTIKALSAWVDRNAESMRKATRRANDLTTAFTLIGKEFGRIRHLAFNIVMTGQGSFYVRPGGAIVHRHTGAGPGPLQGGAAGMLVRAGTGPTADDVLVRVSKGETIVPAHLTPAVAPLMKAHRVPGFAAGGVISRHYQGQAEGIPRFALTMPKVAKEAMTDAMVTAMRAAIKEAKQQMLAVGGGGPVGGDAAANMALARRMFPFSSSQWAPFVSLEMAEAGFNRFAKNPSSGAYGIPQALPPTKMPFAAQEAGGSHAGPQLAWMYAYIASRWGSPAGAWANEVANHWYRNGGMITEPVLGFGASGKLYGFGESGPERVTPASGTFEGSADQRLVRIEKLLAGILKSGQTAPARTGHAVVSGMQRVSMGRTPRPSDWRGV